MIPCCICFGNQISENKYILQEEFGLHIDFFPKNSLNIFKDVKLEIMQKAMSQKNVLKSKNKIATSTTVQNPQK